MLVKDTVLMILKSSRWSKQVQYCRFLEYADYILVVHTRFLAPLFDSSAYIGITLSGFELNIGNGYVVTVFNIVVVFYMHS